MSKAGEKIIDGLNDAVAFAKIDALIGRERRRLERNWKQHPGAASRTQSEYLRGLLDAQALFGTVETKK